MQVPIKKVIFSLVGILVFIIILYFVYQNIVYVTTDNAQIEGHAVLLAPKESGFITKVYVEQGQIVKKMIY
jgi:membrane fusion protein, multidrug efflux system